MAEQTINLTQGLTIVANINMTALGHGILTVANVYHESLVKLYPTLKKERGDVYFDVKLNGQKYEKQLVLRTSCFNARWQRASLNIRIFLNDEFKKYVKETCQVGEILQLTLSTQESDTFIANILKG